MTIEMKFKRESHVPKRYFIDSHMGSKTKSGIGFNNLLDEASHIKIEVEMDFAMGERACKMFDEIAKR